MELEKRKRKLFHKKYKTLDSSIRNWFYMVFKLILEFSKEILILIVIAFLLDILSVIVVKMIT